MYRGRTVHLFYNPRSLLRSFFVKKDIPKRIKIVTDNPIINCEPVIENRSANCKEYASIVAVINFETEAISKNLFGDTCPIPAPTHMISSGRIGMMNNMKIINVSFLETYCWYFFS